MDKEHKKTKIVLLTDCLADLKGGAEKQIFELAKGLDKKRYDITVASLECEGHMSGDLFESMECRLVLFPVKRIYGLSGFLEGFRFIRFLKEQRIDILMTYHFSSDIWGTIMAKIAGVPVIVSNRRDMGFWRGQRHIYAYKLINRFVRKIIVNAQAIKTSFIKEEGIKEQKIQVIYNGIALQSAKRGTRGTSLRKNLGIKKGDWIIVHVANIKPVKGHSYLINALAKIVPKHPNVKLLLIGEDKLNGQINNLVDQLGIAKNVVFLGKRDDVSSLIRLADIGILPSLSEGMSNAIMEYMQAGKPVITTDVGGNPELVEHGRTGLLIDKANEEQLADALFLLIGDPKKCLKMGKQGYHKITKSFSATRMLDQYDRLFKTYVSDKTKILHLISSSGLFGAENIVLTLGKNIQDNQFNSIVGAFHNNHDAKNEIIERARELGVETYSLTCNGRFDLGAVFRLKKYLVQNQIDVLHTHNYKSDVIGLIASKMAGIPVVATAHGFTDVSRAVSAYEKLDRWALKSFFKKVIVVTDSVLKGFPADKKRIISNGINIGHYAVDGKKGAILRKKFHIAGGEILIGMIGRLSREKNQKMLLEAVYPIMRDNVDVKVIIVGDGPKRDELKQFGEARHMTDRIIFTGILQDTVPVYSAIDIFVLSSQTEGVPLTILEAMASEVPVVATRVGGVPNIIEDGQTGFLVDSKDTQALRGRIEELINDREKGQQLAKSAYIFVKDHYSEGKMSDAYKKVYREVLN